MMAADTNVRPAWRASAASARRARRSGLARLLLEKFGRLLRKLDLTFLLLLVVVPTPACIIPVGPDWRDPFGAPDAAPQILDPNPEHGAEVFGSLSDPREFQIVVTDVNVTDDLYIRWVVDGQRTDHMLPFVMHLDGGQQLRALSKKRVTCQDIADKSLTHHLVIAAVADRAFDDTTPDPLVVTEPGQSNRVVWFLTMACLQ